MRRLLFLLILLLSLIPITAQDEPLSISPALQAQIEELEATTTRLRGLAELSDVSLVFPTREDVRAYLENAFDIALTDEIMAQETAFYTAFDFISPDLDLREFYLNLYEQQVAGFYDTETQEMNVILSSGEIPEDALPAMEQIIYVHEYVHALQDQHFDLDALLTAVQEGDNNDRALALMSLVEGDATTIMNDYTVTLAEENPMGTIFSLLLSGLEAGNLTLPPGVPRIVEQELIFPYLGGEQFIRAIQAQGGWEAVNALYDSPPQTMEQIIHPQKYLASEMMIPVDLPETTPEGWTLIDSGSLGELYLREYLRTQLLPSESVAAAAGWGGDVYRIYHDEAGQQAWITKIAWDDDAEMAEFHTAYTEFMTERSESALNDDNCVVDDTGWLCLHTTQDNHSLIISAPDEATYRLLLADHPIVTD